MSDGNKPVLVIEDSECHQAAARAQLPDAIVVNYDEAFEIFRRARPGEFRAILTDLFFLVERNREIPPAPFSHNYEENCAMIGTKQPFGLAFVLKAVELGIPGTLVTDSNHHSSIFTGLLDIFARYQFKDEGPLFRKKGGGDPDLSSPVPDPRFAILSDCACPFAEDMYWENGKVVMEPLPSWDERGAKPEIQAVKDWREALSVIITAQKKS